MNAKNKVIIFSAPSGSGKTTIVKSLLQRGLPLEFSVSACNRPKRENEINGKDYYFLSTEEFKQKISESAFVEWEEVYEGSYYGTLKEEVNRIWENNKAVAFDVDVKGGINLKKLYGNKALSVFIKPPSIEELEIRLRNRGTENEETLKKRINKASYEMTFESQFDVEVVNDNLMEAEKKTYDIVCKFLE